MAIRRIIDIELNDAPLKKFTDGLKEADKVTKTIESTAAKISANIRISEEESTEHLKVLGDILDVNKKHLEIVEAQVEKERQATEEAKKRADEQARIAEEAKKVSARYDEFKKSMATIGREWHGVVRDVKTFAEKIETATRSILKWSGIFGLASGVLGLGGLFGIERLAASTGASRRSSLGLGTTIGEKNAFDTNYGRLVDTEGFLGGVNESLHDVTKRVGLTGAGLTQQDIAGKDTAQVADLLIPALKKIADATPEAQLGNVLRARHLDQFMSEQDFQRLKHTPASEVDQYRKSYGQDIKNLDLADKTAKAWQDLMVQLTRAGLMIENVLVKSLAPLAEPLTHLSEALVKLVKDLSESGTFKEWVQGLSDSVKWLDETLRSDKFRKSVIEFVEDLGVLVKALGVAIHGVADWFRNGPATTPNGTGPSPDGDVPEQQKGWFFDWKSGQFRYYGGGIQKESYDVPGGGNPLLQNAAFGAMCGCNDSAPGGRNPMLQDAAFRTTSGAGSDSQAQAAAYFQSKGWSPEQTAGILDNLVTESGRNLNPQAHNLAEDDRGIAQWRGNRSAQFQALFGHDLLQATQMEQLQFVQWELTHTMKAAGDKLRNARTRYEAADVVNHDYEVSRDPTSYRAGRAGAVAPAGPGSFARNYDGSRGLTVKVENMTGGAVSVTAAQLAV